MLFVASCSHPTVENDLKDIQTPVEIAPPGWMPPKAPDIWLSMDMPSAPDKKEIPEEEVISTAPLVVRDTIEGIAVRSPGLIQLPEEDNTVAPLDSIGEAYYNMSYISTNSYFGITFDNDIFSNTDYYYTNGINFELAAPIFASSPLAWPMLPYSKESINYHGMKMVQNMYTPTNPDTISVMEGDRPFAAYLYIGHTKNTLSKRKKYRQYSEIVIGLIGPGSLGGFVQAQIHDIDPVGWSNQIQNDLVLNYSALAEKGIFNTPHFDLNIFGDAQLGTLYDNAGVGIRLRTGKLNPYFSIPGLAKESSSEGKDALNLQYGALADARIRGILYDATLQGGLFNPNNSYTIQASDIERLVLHASIGFYFAIKQIALTYKHNYISPEFKEAKHHQWGHLNISFCF